jgi:HlyD family secretion protein
MKDLTPLACIRLKSQQLKTQGESFKLLPGMRVIAEIHLGQQSILEYLLSPVQKVVREAARER